MHPKHYGKTNVLEFIIHLKRSENRNVEYKLDNEVKMKITFATDLEVDPVEITKERRKFAGYPSAIHIMSQEKHQDQKNHQDQEETLMLKKKRKIEESLMLRKERKNEEPILLKKERKIEKPLMSKFEICEIIRKIYPASDEVIEVYEKGKPRLVSIDI